MIVGNMDNSNKPIIRRRIWTSGKGTNVPCCCGDGGGGMVNKKPAHSYYKTTRSQVGRRAKREDVVRRLKLLEITGISHPIPVSIVWFYSLLLLKLIYTMS